MKRPGRPLGVMLAIVASTFLYSLLPLMMVAMIALVAFRFRNPSVPEDLEPIAMGGDFIGFSPGTLILQTVLAVIFFIIVVMAWRGRPPYMRLVMSAAVLGLTALKFLSIILNALSAQTLQAGLSSSDAFWDSIAWGEFVLGALVSLYVVWYMNRAPARAFYRGHYLPHELAARQDEDAERPSP